MFSFDLPYHIVNKDVEAVNFSAASTASASASASASIL